TAQTLQAEIPRPALRPRTVSTSIIAVRELFFNTFVHFLDTPPAPQVQPPTAPAKTPPLLPENSCGQIPARKKDFRPKLPPAAYNPIRAALLRCPAAGTARFPLEDHHGRFQRSDSRRGHRGICLRPGAGAAGRPPRSPGRPPGDGPRPGRRVRDGAFLDAG